jgi:phage tail sheath protein FI
MPSYLHPGVYIEEIPSGAKPIEGVSTSVAALVGYTTEGPINEATLVHSWDEYKTSFGDIQSDTDAMGLAAYNFFLNGGKDAYIARLAADAASATLSEDPVTVRMPGTAGGATSINVLEFTARSAGAAGNDLKVQVSAGDGYRFTLTVSTDADGTLETFKSLSMDTSDANYALTVVNGNSAYVEASLPSAVSALYVQAASVSDDLSGGFSITAGSKMNINIDNAGIKALTIGTAGGADITTGSALETAMQAGLTALGGIYATAVVAWDSGDSTISITSPAASAYSRVEVRPGDVAAELLMGTANGGTETRGTDNVVPANMGSAVALKGGDDGSTPGTDDYTSFFLKLKKVRDVNIILLPGQYMADDGSGNAVIDAAVAHCEDMGNRMLLVDPPPSFELEDANDVDTLGLTTSTYAVTYYPWVKMANPFYNKDTNPGVPTTLTVAPSPFAAGIWARTDGTRGVWKAPAGVEATVRGMAALEYTVEDGDQDQLNPEGVNCFRKLPSFGAVVWGTRTRSTKANPEWRYVPVRRTAPYIGSSIRNGIQWAVFEPNDHRLWSSLRANIGAFMDGLFRAGAFQGQKASDAYFVRCGLGDTMTQDDIDRGQVIAIVGFAPLKPAEFVIVRIQQKVGQS